MCCSGRYRSDGRESPQTVYVRVCGWRKIESSLTSNERRTSTAISARADELAFWHAPAAWKSGPPAVAQVRRTPY